MKKILIFVVLLFVLFTGKSYAENDCVNRPLKQLGTRTESHASFFLGTGGVGQDIFYYMFVKWHNGGYKFVKVDPENVTIFEDTKKASVWWCGGWNGYSGTRYGWDSVFEDNLTSGHSLVINIHIPPGSIENTYKIDLSK